VISNDATSRTLTLVGAAAVAIVTLVISSVHIYELSVIAGAGWLAFLVPASVDGLGLSSAVAAWNARRNNEKVPVAAVTALGLRLVGRLRAF
jgi:hypothetical protein